MDATESATASIEPEADFRVPSGYPRCRRQRCHQPPVADMRRWRTDWGAPELSHSTWWAYCAGHLREYGREVRGGRVWRVR
jgi:hypothetical protein